MGGCSSDLMQRLGPTFGDYLAAEKSKKIVDETVRDFKSSINQQA
jgi:ubiquinone biosynthesis protein UbiJ